MKWPDHPTVHEVFTWVWLAELAEAAGRPVTLDDVPDEAWDELARPGVDAVWLMGVWERSPMGAAIARTNPSMLAAHQATLADLRDDDVVGSAYCVRSYQVDPHLGGDEGLATARAALASRGVRLVLDFVPNHIAPDHAWVTEHPAYLIAGSADDLERDPASFIQTAGGVFACGRDPYFPAWPEVVQLDASLVAVREAAAETVGAIAERCDGVRCDMAMLVLDDVFVRTWGERARGGPSPGDGRGYWRHVIEQVRATHPGFAFWAEAYWDLEPVLVEQGFDACYDKRLYDRLVHHEGAASIRAHLVADLAWQRHTVRFVENHDEPRAAAVLDSRQHRAAATVALTLPGVALVHEGQTVGRRARTPVTLGRRPAESPDVALQAWYDRLFAALADGLRTGRWALAAVEGWPDNTSCNRLVAWTWTTLDDAYLVVVNLSDQPADGRVRLDLTGAPETVAFEDALSGETYIRDAQRVRDEGLYVALEGFGVHLLWWSRET
jgi:glycosidase